jgi:hypothetical protein
MRHICQQREEKFKLITNYYILFSGIKKYIVGLIIKTSSDPDIMEREKMYLNKLNMILVQVRFCPKTSDILALCLFGWGGGGPFHAECLSHTFSVVLCLDILLLNKLPLFQQR